MKTWEYKEGKYISIDDPLIPTEPEDCTDWDRFRRRRGYINSDYIVGQEFNGISIWELGHTDKEVVELYPFIMQIELAANVYDIYIKEFPDVLNFLKEYANIFLHRSFDETLIDR